MGGSRRALALVIAGALALAFGTPLRAAWAARGAPAWLPYALWAAAIVALVVAARRSDR
jgi:hypothetical protein